MENKRESSKETEQPLTGDPVYLVMAGVFAFLTTVLPIALTQPRTMPVVQALILTLFTALPIRAGLWRRAVRITALWLTVTLLLITVISFSAPAQVEASLSNGFEYRAQLLEWMYGVGAYPSWQASLTMSTALRVGAFTLGSVVTAGAVGYWFVFQQINHLGYAIGLVWSTVGGFIGLLLAVPFWSLLQVVGLAGLVIMLSEPILFRSWSARHFWRDRRTLIIVCCSALILGYLLALFVPVIWQQLINARTQLS